MRMVQRPLLRLPVRRSLVISGFHEPNGLGCFFGSIRNRSLRVRERSTSAAPAAPKASDADGPRLSFITSAIKQPRLASAASGRKTCQMGVNPRDAPEKFDGGCSSDNAAATGESDRA